jgi:hypothetical protein
MCIVRRGMDTCGLVASVVIPEMTSVEIEGPLGSSFCTTFKVIWSSRKTRIWG